VEVEQREARRVKEKERKWRGKKKERPSHPSGSSKIH